MATLLSAIETQVRRHLEESSPKFWSSAEIIDHIIAGAKDLWRPVVELKQEHFLTISSSVTLAADTATISSVPTDVHKIVYIRPDDLTESSTSKLLDFRPASYNSPEFQNSLQGEAIDPADGGTVYYAIVGQGAPIGAPTIYVAPQISSAVTLSFAYVPILGTLTSASNNPIPGESDNALVAWAVAYARAKEREDRSPDPNWLAVYGTEKSHLLEALGVRQYQEAERVQAVFQSYWE